MEIIIGVAIPLITFFLGIGFTLFYTRYQERRSMLRQHVEETVRLVNDWYNQLHTLSMESRRKPLNSFTNDVDDYLSNRIVLPKLMYNVAILKEFGEAPGLVMETEAFLRLLTSYQDCNSLSAPNLRIFDTPRGLVSWDRGKRVLVENVICTDMSLNNEQQIMRTLEEIDRQLQKVTIEGAKAVAGANEKHLEVLRLPISRD